MGIPVNRKPERAVQEKVRDLKQMTALSIGSYVSFSSIIVRSPGRGLEPIQECFNKKQGDGSVKAIKAIAESELDGYSYSHLICKQSFILQSICYHSLNDFSGILMPTVPTLFPSQRLGG